MKSTYFLFSLLLLGLLTGLEASWSYSVVDTYTDSTHSFYTATLKYDGNQSYYTNQTNYVVDTLNFTYFFTSPSHLIVRLTDPQKKRWEVPHEFPFPHSDHTKKFAPYEKALVQVQVTKSPFSFKVIRTSTNEVIFDSSVGELIYSDYYIQISTALTTPNLYGLGERVFKLNLGPDGTYSILTKDLPAVIEDGTSGNNLYGYHPVYLLREKSDSFHMNLLRSSNAMDVKIEGGKKLTYKVVGGIFDFNFFLGQQDDTTPETIVKQYHTYLGGWALQPFWSFGFHQCRWGYKNIKALTDVLENYSKNDLPLDVIWSDIDYMEKYIDFTIDKTRFPPNQMRDMLAKYKKRWVPIIDAGIAVNNEIHTIGLKNNVYIKSPNGTNLEGQVWPGNVNYPDWFNPNTSLFWDIGLNLLYQEVPFHGVWLDMNEASNFVPGENGFVPAKDDLLNLPPYKPARPEEFIFTKTMRMDAVHHGGLLENDVHNTFGFLGSKATYNFLKTIDDLTFIVTRSSFYGTGRYSAHWTGDNGATYEFLALSIPGIISSGFFGLPMTGADICGFAGDTNEELCARWFQLGSLYPFARDHNDDNSRPQEPYAFGPTLLFTARHNLKFRYAILKHYYAQFLKQKGTGTIFRPMFFEFPTDDNLYDSSLGITDSQFLIGGGLMAAPALKKGVNSVNVYFPKDTWFDFLTGELIKTFKEQPSTVQRNAFLNTTAPIFIRGGHIAATQDTDKVNRTDELDNVYTLIIAFKETQKTGSHYALGDMVGIKNFDSTNVMSKCRLDNCLYTVNASIVNYGSEFDLLIDFFAQGTPNKYEDVKIKRLFMMGDWADQFDSLSQLHDNFELIHNLGTHVQVNHLSETVIDYNFETPFSLKPGAQIKMHLNNKNVIKSEAINI